MCICIYISDSAVTSAIYASVASTRVVRACCLNFRGCLIINSCKRIPELTTSWCSILPTVKTYEFVDHGGFRLWAALNWSCSSLSTPALCYIVTGRPATSIRQHSHPTVCCFLFMLLPVLRPIFACASMVTFSVAAFAALQWTSWWLCGSWVSAGSLLDEAHIILLDSDSLPPCWGVCGAKISWCGCDEMMITKRSGMSWGIYS